MRGSTDVADRTQRQQQRARTHEALLEATLRCLVGYGYAGTTTQRIQDEAGVSRGALLHHFSSKADLLVAATHYVADVRLQKIADVAGALDDGPEGLEQLVSAIREAMTGPPYQAAIELWTASRTDPQLRDALLPAERKLGAALHDLFNRHAGIPDQTETRIAFESLMAMLRGLELRRIMHAEPEIADQVVQRWLEDTLRIRRRGDYSAESC